MASGNGDGQADKKEDSQWRCNKCGASGKCAKGDEKVALALHMALMHD